MALFQSQMRCHIITYFNAATPKKRGSVSSTDTDGSSPGKFDRKRLSKDVRSYDIIGEF